MKQRPKQPLPGKSPTLLASNADQIVQIKVWLLGISPMAWRRVLVPAAYTVRALHGVIQVVMGWEGIHLYQFRLRAARYGSRELSASSPDVTLAALQLRKGTRFIYEYDLNVPWRHEVRIEDRLSPEAGKAYPICTGAAVVVRRRIVVDPLISWRVATKCCRWMPWKTLPLWPRSSARLLWSGGRRSSPMKRPGGDWSRPSNAVKRACVPRGQPFSRGGVNTRLRRGEHRDLMHQHG